MKWRIPAILSAACLLFTASACGRPSESASSSPSTAPATTTTTTAKPTTTTTSPYAINIFTGKQDVDDAAGTRPVAVMIDNVSQARPQYGLDKADLLLEAETEGGITRIMAVFANASRVPDKIGPVRSARSPFVLLARSFDAVYCHAGGSKAGLATLKSTGVTDIDGIGAASSSFWRDSYLLQSRSAEHTLVTSGKKLASRISASKIRNTTQRSAFFSYGEVSGSGAGQKLQVTFSGAQKVSFVYSDGAYLKSNGSLGNATSHKMVDGSQIRVANVLVLYDQKYSENSTTISFRLNNGNGLLLSGGSSRNIQWSRSTNGLSVTETDGSAAKFATGPTYICLVSKDNASQTVVG